jgi:hypothetical protein
MVEFGRTYQTTQPALSLATVDTDADPTEEETP